MSFDNHLSKLGFLFVIIQTLTVITSCAIRVCELGLFEGDSAEVVSFVRGPRYQKGCEPLLCLNANWTLWRVCTYLLFHCIGKLILLSSSVVLLFHL